MVKKNETENMYKDMTNPYLYDCSFVRNETVATCEGGALEIQLHGFISSSSLEQLTERYGKFFIGKYLGVSTLVFPDKYKSISEV